MFFIAYIFNRQVHVSAGQVKIVSHLSCKTSAILKYFCPLYGVNLFFYFTSKHNGVGAQKNRLIEMVLLNTLNIC